MEANKFDVFISYRRESGTYQAQALRADLEHRLCSVFMDTSKMGSGDFTKKLAKKIREYSNFVVVISKDCFPHKKKSKDYFLYEIGLALRLGKNVIPIYYDGMEYKDIEEYLYGIENFQNQNAITFHNDAPEGSVNQIISFLKTKEEVLKERYETLSEERITTRKELMKLESFKAEHNCPVCNDTSHSVTMSYCPICGYRFFDKLEEFVAEDNELIQESERLEKHKELWSKCQSGEDNTISELKKELKKTRVLLQLSESQRADLERQLKAINGPQKGTAQVPNSIEFHLNDNMSFKMILVEGGKFMMGASASDYGASDDERPQHMVSLSNYYIGETVVTQALWKAVMGSNPSNYKGDLNPVECVSWTDCKEFVLKLNNHANMRKELEGLEFRLPTEAEWEYAARGGKKSKGYRYAGGNTISDVAWYKDNSNGKTHPVKSKQSNELELYDMSGNIWEWCQDWYSKKYYKESPSDNPQGPFSGSARVLRGGSCGLDARGCRVTYRNNGDPSNLYSNVGFRLVLASIWTRRYEH